MNESMQIPTGDLSDFNYSADWDDEIAEPVRNALFLLFEIFSNGIKKWLNIVLS